MQEMQPPMGCSGMHHPVLWFVAARNPALFSQPHARGDVSDAVQLLACALACFTIPWESAAKAQSGVPGRASTSQAPTSEAQDMVVAQAYWLAAKKRIGLLGDALIDIQCLFFASVFERYALRPLEAWFYIQMACTRLEAYLLRNNRQSWRPEQTTDDPTRLLEQRVFWTCVKGKGMYQFLSRHVSISRTTFALLLSVRPSCWNL